MIFNTLTSFNFYCLNDVFLNMNKTIPVSFAAGLKHQQACCNAPEPRIPRALPTPTLNNLPSPKPLHHQLEP